MANNRVYTILVDTNAILHLSLYLDLCSALGKELGIGEESIKCELEDQKAIKASHIDPHYKYGLNLYKYLLEKRDCYANLIVLFSLISEIELLNVLLERVFDRKLKEKGIPYRLRRRSLFGVQVDFNYEEEVAKYWEDKKAKLVRHDIELEYPEEKEGIMGDIVRVSRIVSRYVVLENMDLYLYALAVLCRADEVYTHDEQFRSRINDIRNNANWRYISDSIQNDLKEYIFSFKDEYEARGRIVLPEGVNG